MPCVALERRVLTIKHVDLLSSRSRSKRHIGTVGGNLTADLNICFSGKISCEHPCMIYATSEFGFVPESGGYGNGSNPVAVHVPGCFLWDTRTIRCWIMEDLRDNTTLKKLCWVKGGAAFFVFWEMTSPFVGALKLRSWQNSSIFKFVYLKCWGGHRGRYFFSSSHLRLEVRGGGVWTDRP